MKTMKFVNKVIAVIIWCAIMTPSAIVVRKTTPIFNDWFKNNTK